MILGIGTDVIEHFRVQQELAGNLWTDDGIFTRQEVASCRVSRQYVARYAACFAAKEASLKALGLAVGDLGVFREVELGEDDEGAPTVLFHGRVKARSELLGVRRVKVSIAAAKKLTGAMVVLES